MRVIIRKEHTIGNQFLDCKDCALNRAIREQHPSFNLQSIGGDYIRDCNDVQYFFNSRSSQGGWSIIAFDKLREGVKEEVVLNIPVPGYDKQPAYPDLTRQLAVLPSDRREVDLIPSPPTPVVTTLVTNLK